MVHFTVDTARLLHARQVVQAGVVRAAAGDIALADLAGCGVQAEDAGVTVGVVAFTADLWLRKFVLP